MAEPGYDLLIDLIVNRVNDEILEATKHEEEPEKQRIHVIRWNAMRTLVDDIQNDISQTRQERDRILSMRREEEEENARLRSARAV